MAQLSRPFQIALVAAAVAAGVLVFALHGRSTSTSNSGSAPVVSASAPALSKPTGHTLSKATVHAKAVARSAHGEHGSGSSLGGLSHAVAKARGAADAGHSSRPASSAKHAGSSAATTVQHPASAAPAASTHTAVKPQPIKAQAGAGRTPARQLLVERALDEGKIAVILFWNPNGTDDAIVDGELRLLEAVHHQIRPLARTPQLRQELKASGLELEKPFAAFASPASEVASYGSITRGVQVYQTPTLLVVNKSGHAIVLTGVQDAFSIEQAIDEARSS